MRRIAPVLLLLLLVACGKENAPPSFGTDPVVTVVVTASSCTITGTDALKPGLTRFHVQNDVKEKRATFSIRDEHGSTVISSPGVVNGSAVDLTANITGGHYKVLCNEHLSDFHVTGVAAPSPDTGTPVAITAKDYAFGGLEALAPKAGDVVTFTLKNNGKATHELQVFAPNGAKAGAVGHVKPGKSGTATVTFGTKGTYRYLCAIDDHSARGMKGTITVS
jgi:plastocyanin